MTKNSLTHKPTPADEGMAAARRDAANSTAEVRARQLLNHAHKLLSKIQLSLSDYQEQNLNWDDVRNMANMVRSLADAAHNIDAIDHDEAVEIWESV